jgi:hypothetical protein
MGMLVVFSRGGKFACFFFLCMESLWFFGDGNLVILFRD